MQKMAAYFQNYQFVSYLYCHLLLGLFAVAIALHLLTSVSTMVQYIITSISIIIVVVIVVSTFVTVMRVLSATEQLSVKDLLKVPPPPTQ